MSKIFDIDQALDLIQTGDTVAFGGVGLTGYPEYIAAQLERRFLDRQSPRNLFVIGSSGQGDRKGCGADHFAHPGMVSGALMGHFRASPKLSKMAIKGEIEAYCLPQGVLVQLIRAAGAGQPGILTEVGLGTYIDPRLEAGRVNAYSKRTVARVMVVDGKEYLFYPVVPIHVAVVRGTTADEDGNITIEREALKLELVELATAARASRGKVIVQVEKVVEAGSLNPQHVVVPGICVDAVVVAPPEGKNHWQTLWHPYSAQFSGECSSRVEREPLPLSIVKVIARRACQEIKPGAVVNIGMGISGAVSPVASEMGLLKEFTFTIEMGAIGGEPAGYPDFAATYNPSSFMSHVQMFDFYHGYGSDISFLGAGEIDAQGNVNVSRIGSTAGQGGFIDITHKARTIVFCMEFIRGAEYEIGDSGLKILQEGDYRKFVKQVGQITFCGDGALTKGQTVKVITERVVMELRDRRWTITEIAPGIDLEKNVLPYLEFTPEISDNLQIMDRKLFGR